MGTLDGPLRRTARQLLNTFGTSATLHMLKPRAIDTSTGTTGAPKETEVPVRGAIEQYKARFAAGEAGGVRDGDVQFTIAAAELTRAPATTDRVTIEGRKYQIVHVDSTYSGDQVALYALHLRR